MNSRRRGLLRTLKAFHHPAQGWRGSARLPWVNGRGANRLYAPPMRGVASAPNASASISGVFIFNGNRESCRKAKQGMQSKSRCARKVSQGIIPKSTVNLGSAHFLRLRFGLRRQAAWRAEVERRRQRDAAFCYRCSDCIWHRWDLGCWPLEFFFVLLLAAPK